VLDPQGAKRLVSLGTVSCQAVVGCLLLLRTRPADLRLLSFRQQGKCEGSFQALSLLLAIFKTPMRTLARVLLFHSISSAQYRPQQSLL